MSAMLVSFLMVCVATSFVCTAIKEDEGARLARGSTRLFAMMCVGILAFGLVVQLLTLVAR